MESNARIRMIVKKAKERNMISEKAILPYVWSLLLVFKITGLATFSVMKNATTQEERAFPIFVPSRLGRLYNLVVVAVMIGSTYLSIPYRIDSRYPGKSAVTTSIEVFQTILGVLAICAMLLSSCFYEDVLVKSGNRLVNIEQALHQLTRPINRARIFREFLCAYLFCISLIVIVFAMEIIAFTAIPLSWLSDLLPTFVISLYFIQYFFMVSLLMAYFTDVNRGMQSLARMSDLTIESLHQPRRMFFGGSSVATLLQLRNIHEWLCEISGEISQFYSLPILFGIAFIFLAVVYNAYYFVICFTVEQVVTLTFLANTVSWIVTLLYPILLLTTKITKINNEIQKLGNIVHTLLSCTVNREAQTQLKLLSLQLLHQDIKFTASGFFALDNTLFHSIVSAATTYLVIVLQFHLGSKPSNQAPRNCT